MTFFIYFNKKKINLIVEITLMMLKNHLLKKVNG